MNRLAPSRVAWRRPAWRWVDWSVRIVLFLSDMVEAAEIVERGVVIGDSFTPVLPLSSPAVNVVISFHLTPPDLKK